MNKNVIKMLVAGLTCVTLCGTTLAAPHMRGNGGRAGHNAPMHQHAPRAHRAPTPERHHAPPPRECHPHPGDHHEGAGWIALGAAVLGGVVGGIVGACH